ncbi:MAG: hypothetical protein KJ767_03995 [Nanoarchaeota archaeon]|nr:hypothetical protein [Nanoarchaeota archaeon]
MEKQKIIEALKKLKEEKRKFSQSIDLVIILKGIDTKKENVNVFVVLPNKIKDKKVCLFSEKPVSGADKICNKIVLKEQFAEFDKKKSKQMAQENDFFVAPATIMASVASAFGKVLGPTGKMPSPAIGSILAKTDEKSLKEIVDKLNRTFRVRTVKADVSLKLPIGNQKMEDEKIVENIRAAEESIIKNLPKGKENIKSILIKTTMGNPIKLE